MKKNIYPLSMGAFCFGMAEFIMMSILPDAARGLGITIVQAGNLVGAYALGVCIGAPVLIAVTRNLPLRSILAVLLAVFMLGSILTALSTDYFTALIGRFISGLPHGAFFGAAGIAANRMAEKGKTASSVALVMMGMTLANLLGVPAGSMIGYYISWRILFLFNAGTAGLCLYLIYSWMPDLKAGQRTALGGQFEFLKQMNPWLLAAGTVMVNGGIFAWYSYINPFMTQTAGVDVALMPVLMVLSGGSMCIGNYAGGKLSDFFTPSKTVLFLSVLLVIALSFLFLCGFNPSAAIVIMCLASFCFFGLSAPIQQLFMSEARGSEMMGGALGQLAFNLGNALGAFAGGRVALLYGQMRYTAFAGIWFVLCGIFIFLMCSWRIKTRPSKNLLEKELTDCAAL